MSEYELAVKWAFEEHTDNLVGVNIVNCAMCPCGQTTTTSNSLLCRFLPALKRLEELEKK